MVQDASYIEKGVPLKIGGFTSKEVLESPGCPNLMGWLKGVKSNWRSPLERGVKPSGKHFFEKGHNRGGKESGF